MIDLSVKVIVGIGLFVVVVCILLLIFGKRDDDEQQAPPQQFPADYCVREAEWALFCYQCALADKAESADD